MSNAATTAAPKMCPICKGIVVLFSDYEDNIEAGIGVQCLECDWKETMADLRKQRNSFHRRCQRAEGVNIRLERQLGEAHVIISQAIKLQAGALAVSKNLPKTKDGATVMPGMVVYAANPFGDEDDERTVQPFHEWGDPEDDDAQSVPWAMNDKQTYRSARDCYSTRAAAEAAAVGVGR